MAKLTTGIYAPTQVFYYDNTEELDIETISRHAVRPAKAGVAGIAKNGPNGAVVYLSADERAKTTRSTLQAQSVPGTGRLCNEQAASGADAVLLMVPSFFKWAMDAVAIKR